MGMQAGMEGEPHVGRKVYLCGGGVSGEPGEGLLQKDGKS